MSAIDLDQDLLARRRARASEFRQARSAEGTLVVHLMSSPGAGKTALLEATARCWQGRHSLAVLVGDLATDRDAQRLRPWCPAVQLTTHGACHLDLSLVERSFAELDRSNPEFLFIEDVGNLVCPASHDVGHHLRVVLHSTPEGDDKAGKYPKAFRTSHALVVSKMDLLPHVPFCLERAFGDALAVQPALRCLTLSAQTGAGLDAWLDFLWSERLRMLESRNASAAGN